jgi:hypothetical protein
MHISHMFYVYGNTTTIARRFTTLLASRHAQVAADAALLASHTAALTAL